MVQHDLFFLWDKVFILLIDEAIRWKAGDHIANKQGPTLIRALMYLWIRLWGPMQYLMSDQESLNKELPPLLENCIRGYT